MRIFLLLAALALAGCVSTPNPTTKTVLEKRVSLETRVHHSAIKPYESGNDAVRENERMRDLVASTMPASDTKEVYRLVATDNSWVKVTKEQFNLVEVGGKFEGAWR